MSKSKKQQEGGKSKPKTAQRFADGETRIKFWTDKLSALQETGVSMKQFIKDAAIYYREVQAYHDIATQIEANTAQIQKLVREQKEKGEIEQIRRKIYYELQPRRDAYVIALQTAGEVIYGEAVALNLPTRPLDILHSNLIGSDELRKVLRKARQLILEAQALASTKQKSVRNKKRRKYTVELLKHVRATFDQRRDGGMDVKGAWNEAAEAYGIKSSKAAEMACRRYLNKQNK